MEKRAQGRGDAESRARVVGERQSGRRVFSNEEMPRPKRARESEKENKKAKVVVEEVEEEEDVESSDTGEEELEKRGREEAKRRKVEAPVPEFVGPWLDHEGNEVEEESEESELDDDLQFMLATVLAAFGRLKSSATRFRMDVLLKANAASMIALDAAIFARSVSGLSSKDRKRLKDMMTRVSDQVEGVVSAFQASEEESSEPVSWASLMSHLDKVRDVLTDFIRDA